MSSREDIQKELQEISPAIAAQSRQNVYSVPLNYFDGLAGNIVHLINADVAGQSFPSATATPFTVSPQYFDTLASQIMATIRLKSNEVSEVTRELADVAPLLNKIDKRMIFDVPHGYFESLQANLRPEKALAPVIKMQGYKKFMNVAIAAAFTGVIAVSSFLLSPSANKNFSEIDSKAPLSLTAEVTNVSEAEIVDYLDNNSFGPEISLLQISQDEDIDINAVIQNVSEEEIREFLKEDKEVPARKPKES